MFRLRRKGIQMRTLARAEGLQSGLVSQRELSGLDNQLETSVDGLLGLLLHDGNEKRHPCSEPESREPHERKISFYPIINIEALAVLLNVPASSTPFFNIF